MSLQSRVDRLEREEEKGRKSEVPRVHLRVLKDGEEEPEEWPEDIPEGDKILWIRYVKTKHDPEEGDYEPSEAP